MPEQPDKPGADFERDDKLLDAEDEAVKNQSEVKPDDHPAAASGEQAA